MATLTKKNEAVALPLFKNGVTLQAFTITFPSSVAALLDADVTNANPRSPVVVALEAVAQVASIEILGALQNSNTELPIMIAALGGNFGTDTWDGTNSETFAAHLEDLIQACGTHQGINLGSASVAAGGTF